MRGGLSIILIVLALTGTHAQTILPDSIASRYANVPRDSNYVNELNLLATSYLRFSPGLARKIATHITEIAPEVRYTRGYARALTIIGNSYYYEGIYEFAQNYYLLSARQYLSIADSIGLSQTYNNLGEVFKRLGEYKKALQYLTESVQLKENNGSTSAMSYYNIGELYIMLNDLNKASKNIELSLSQAIRTDDRRVIAYDYRGLGLIRYKQGQHESALDFLGRAEKLWKELGEIRSLIQTYHDLADVYRSLGLYDKSERYLSLSIEMASLIKAPDLMVNNYLQMAYLDSAKGDYREAMRDINRYTKLKDSVYNLSKSEQIAKLQALYEAEAMDRENQQLRDKQRFNDSQLKLQSQIIIAISIGLGLTIVMAWLLSRQRKKTLAVNRILHGKNDEISTQKLAIEMQATALVKLNEQLQELNKNLERRIDERTEQLMVQNQKLTEYTFVNAHKLRAPVSSILGLINLLEQVDAREQAIIYNHLKTCSEQLDIITRQISRNLEDGIIENN